ncbi:hypothetical protein O6H91_13G006300 [Diphasiastrum complanatum]|uniref:Uncharacterized protein n=1 Tax=Diphasiastrum complanatum TaxID=34168 RepID=A0ACC2BRW5_DIPCM|nr:hypothetical protein O6H91_13G006300 [Diphasiastrum complanatum]
MGRRKIMLLWGGIAVAIALRSILMGINAPLLLGRSVEVATPITSLKRLAEGYWRKQLGMSPYTGGTYHGSPLLLVCLGHYLEKSLIIFLIADLSGALLLHLIGEILVTVNLKPSDLGDPNKSSLHTHDPEQLSTGNLAALLYLLNPFTIVSCVGGSTSPIENVIILLALYAAIAGNAPLAAFGWALATHLSLYPAILFIPVAVALVGGPDRPSRSLFQNLATSINKNGKSIDGLHGRHQILEGLKWQCLFDLIAWSGIWWLSILGFCSLVLHKQPNGLYEMFKETYGFILTVEDLTPNMGLFWYFFMEVFDFFRPFFLMVFHANILCMLLPLTIRLHHRPLFLSFIFIVVWTVLKSYPSVGDMALYFGLMTLFMEELLGFRYAFLLLNGYICTAILGPVMYNLWIWRGTGNANFYFATALVHAFIQIILIVEGVSTMLKYDRSLKKLVDSLRDCDAHKVPHNEQSEPPPPVEVLTSPIATARA